MSVETCKLEKGLCRCCFNDGSYKNLSDPCLDQGKQVLYSEMLQKCLNIELSPVTGPLCAATYMICDDCILRLTDACHFRQQVILCEQRFQELYGKNIIKLAPSYEVPIKEEIIDDDDKDIKLCLSPMEDDDDNDFSLQDDDDDDKYEPESDTQEPIKKPKTRQVKSKAKTKGRPKGRPQKPPRKQTAPEDETDGDNEKKGTPDYYHILDSQFVCNLCQRTFASQPLVSQHYRFVHLKRRPKERKCPHCDKKVPAHLRAYHLEEAHGVPAPSCGICQRRFRYPYHVLQHQKKVHMGEKLVTCTVCDKDFFDNLTLKSHMLTHSSEKRFKCDVCEQEFRWKNNLKDHILVHMGDKRYECKVCGKAYVQKSSLKKHTMKNHY